MTHTAIEALSIIGKRISKKSAEVAERKQS